MFSKKSTTVLLEHIEINTHAIDLKKGKQSPYGPIYSLGLMELEILKTYIEINLANYFFYTSKLLTTAPILFNKKPNRSLWLCVDY